MPSPSEKLAESLEVLHGTATCRRRCRDSDARSDAHAPRAACGERIPAEGNQGMVHPVPTRRGPGESTAWYAAFWPFAARYLETRFGRNWSLSPEQSLSLHGGNWTVPASTGGARSERPATRSPRSLTARPCWICAPRFPRRQTGRKKRACGSSRSTRALIACSPNYFSHHATDVRAALATVRDPSRLLAGLLEGGHSTIAGRLAGAFRNNGRDAVADEIVKTMTAAGYSVRETDPFQDRPALALPARETSPYVNRMRLLWQKMREPVIARFPRAPGLPANAHAVHERRRRGLRD